MPVTSVWRQVTRQEQLEPYRGLATRYCVKGCVFLYGVRRNAWHSTTVSYWHFGTAYFPSRDLLLSAAEGARRQGSHLWYTELPAIVLKRGLKSLLVIQPGADAPFSNYREVEAADTSLASIAEALKQGNKRAEIWEHTPAQSRWTGEYMLYDSTSLGPEQMLHWTPLRKAFDTRVFEEVVQSLTAEIAEA